MPSNTAATQLIILRGISGSGKRTTAKALQQAKKAKLGAEPA